MIVSLAILMAGLFVTTLILAARAWSNYQLAGRIARVAGTDESIFNALVSVRLQVPRDSMALTDLDDPLPVIKSTYGEAALAVQGALSALRRSDIPESARLAQGVQVT